MSKQQNPPVSYGDYTSEELHAIVQRAHRERAQALRELIASLFARRKATAEAPEQRAHHDAVACS